MQVERRHRLVLVFREAERLKGELRLLGGSIQVHHRLRIFGTPNKQVIEGAVGGGGAGAGIATIQKNIEPVCQISGLDLHEDSGLQLEATLGHGHGLPVFLILVQ